MQELRLYGCYLLTDKGVATAASSFTVSPHVYYMRFTNTVVKSLFIVFQKLNYLDITYTSLGERTLRAFANVVKHRNQHGGVRGKMQVNRQTVWDSFHV